MKVLITGVAGFIGSNLLAHLLSKGHYVIGIDNLSQSDGSNIKEYEGDSRWEFHCQDVRNFEALKKLAQGADAIVHLAAFKIPRYGNALDTLQINVHGTENVLKAALENRCRVIFASTSDVYGKNPSLPFSEKSDLYLGEPSVKRWAYAVSKIFDEQVCFAYHEEYGLPVSIIRYFGGYGPKQNTTWWGGPQSVFIDCALKGNPIPIHGDGRQTRTFTYVGDLVDGTARVLESEAAAGRVFNIGNTREIMIIELAEMIWQMIRPGEEPKIEFISYRSFSGRYEDVRRRTPDISLARALLGFEPRVALEEGLPITIEWQRRAARAGGGL